VEQRWANREPGEGALQTSAYVQVAHAELAMQLAHWAPDTRSAALLLVDNPATLYGFER